MEISKNFLIGLQDESNNTILSIEEVTDEKILKTAKPKKIDANVVGGVVKIARNAPTLSLTQDKIMKVTASSALYKNEAEGFIRAIVKGSDGRIKEHAKLYEMKKMKGLLKLNNVMTFAAVVTSQHYLIEINNELKNIQKSLDNLTKFVEDSFLSKVNFAKKYLSQLSDYSQTNNQLPDAMRQKIEDVEFSAGEVGELAKKTIVRHLNDLPELENDYKKTLPILKDKLENLSSMSELLSKSWKIRLGYVSAMYYYQEKEIALIRTKSIIEEIDSFYESYFKRLKDNYSKSIDELVWGVLDKEEAVLNEKQALRNQLLISLEYFMELYAEVDKFKENGFAKDFNQSEKEVFYLQLNEHETKIISIENQKDKNEVKLDCISKYLVNDNEDINEFSLIRSKENEKLLYDEMKSQQARKSEMVVDKASNLANSGKELASNLASNVDVNDLKNKSSKFIGNKFNKLKNLRG